MTSTLLRLGAIPRSVLLKWLAFALAFFAIIALVRYTFPVNDNCVSQNGTNAIGFDFRCIFRPAVSDLFHGRSPYTGLYFNPPWALLILAPFAALPLPWGAAAIYVTCVTAFMLAGVRLGMNKWSLALLILTSFIWVNAKQGNIDWLVAIGATLPPQIGLFFVLIKPQAGLAVAVFWGVQALTRGWQQAESLSRRARAWSAVKEALRVCGPVFSAYLISFLIFGLWIIPPVSWIDSTQNYSLWPLGIPLGLALLAAAVKGKDVRRAISASPFLSPYLLTYSYAMVYLGLSGWELLAAQWGR